MADTCESVALNVCKKLLAQNRAAYNAVSPVGGNSVQEGYRNNTQKILEEQKDLLDILVEGK